MGSRQVIVHIFNRPISDEPTKSLGIKAEYTVTAVVRWGKIRGHIFNRPISDEPTISLGIKSEYVPRAMVQLVNIFSCLAYDFIGGGNQSNKRNPRPIASH